MSSKEVTDCMKDDSLDNFKNLQISPLEDEDDDNGDADVIDDDDDDEDEEEVPVTLGFVESPKNQWSVLCQLFPSKAGGTPAWLDPINLPGGRSFVCDICGDPLQFLLQVYAPLSEKEQTFHRTLFVFICPSMACLRQDQHEQWKHLPQIPSRSVKVFRCQLARTNPFYSSEHPRYDGYDKPSGNGAKLCSWCGTWKGEKVCSSCRSSRYCSEKHQASHWRSHHRSECRKLSMSAQPSNSSSTSSHMEIQRVASTTLWPQFEIINEDECEFETDMLDNDGHANSLVSSTRVDKTVESLVDGFEGDADRQSWASFQDRIARAPGQVLRYSRHTRAKPLWPMTCGRPSRIDVHKCCYCGSPRGFEFQILPQLLYYFGVRNDIDSLDWATIVVYTCEASCEDSVAYKEEFAWVQSASQ